MQNERTPDSNTGSSGPRVPADAAPTARRTFLREVGKKAVWVTPVVLTLMASPEQAWASAPASGTCVPSGGECGSNDDCCSNSCNVGMMTCNSPSM